MKKIAVLFAFVFYTIFINAQSIKITTPNGGQTLTGCTSNKIKWEQKGVSNYLNVYYSLNAGINWVYITQKYTSAGIADSMDWAVPNIASTQLRIKIQDAYNLLAKDSSDANSTIVADPVNTLTVTSPNGGETFSPSTLKTITWNSKGTVGNVSLNYSTNGGATWEWVRDANGTYAQNIANNGSFSWLIPSNLGMSSKCLILIYEYYKSCNLDYSDAFFNIDNSPAIFITKPVAGEVRYVGRNYYIEWSCFNLPSNSVTIDYSIDNGSTWKIIVDSTYTNTNSYSYNWIIPNTVSNQAILRVSATRNKAIKNQVSFKINTPTIKITRPNGGETVTGCTSNKIKWEQQGVSNYLNIYYSLDAGINWVYMAQKYTSAGVADSMDWAVPNIASTQLRIKIQDAYNLFAKDSSDANATIVADPVNTLTVTSPNGGETFSPSTLKTITWNSKGTVGNVSLNYSTNGGVTWEWVRDANGTYAQNIANNGSFNWLIPSNLGMSSKCLILIYEYYKSCNLDYSDAFFNIDNSPAIFITKPVAGEVRYVGRNYYIEWSCFNLPSNSVTIDYSIDNGSTWKIIVDSTYTNPNGYSYNWIIPNTVSNQAILRVSATRNKAIQHQVNFKINTPTIKITRPNGGETVTGCTSNKIKWEQQGVSNYLNIYYSLDAGINWVYMAQKYTSAGVADSMDWAVPNIASTQLRIKIQDAYNLFAKDSSDANATIVADPVNTLTVTSPNGGETFSPSTLKTITWNSKGTVGNVSLNYSTNGGATWEWVRDANGTYAQNIANNGSFSWLIPSNLGMSSKCLILIYEHYKSCNLDYSDAFFNIDNSPAIFITKPVAGEVRYVGRNYYIEWSCFNLPSNSVTIDYSIDNGSTWKIIVDSTYTNPNGYSYNWIIPNTVSNQAILRVSATRNKAIKNQVSYKINTPTIKITTPNGGESLSACTKHKIKWEQQGASNYLNIYFSLDAGDNWFYSTQKYTSAGAMDSIDWLPPNVSTTKFKIKIQDAYNLFAKDSSDANATIVADPANTLTITSPSGGETFSPSTLKTITWNSKGTVGNVSLLYSNDGGNTWDWVRDAKGNVAQNISNNGAFNWLIPSNLGISSKCLVIVQEYSKVCITHYSAFFNIGNSPNISITNPLMAETCYIGSNYRINWANYNLPSNSVTIDYSIDNGTTWKIIVDSMYTNPNGYYYNWTVPSTVTNQAILRVSATRNKAIRDQVNFKISFPTVKVITPNGGEIWRLGEVKNITWKAEGLEPNSLLKIEYSFTANKKWYPINNSLKNTGSFLWTIPDTLVSSSAYFIKMTSLDFSSCKDSNDVAFSIIKPKVGITVPNNGEIWYVGESKSIQWNSIGGGTGNVKIDYSLNKGITWNVITSSPNTGFYYWTIPNTITPSNNCLIKVTDELNPSISDSSDVVFTIAKPILKLTSPTEKEVWYLGQKQTIKWLNTGKLSLKAKLEISVDNGKNWTIIDATADNNGSYVWQVPITLAASDECLVKISDSMDPSITDVSPIPFSLKKSAIYVTAPNGGEIWYVGQKKSISWKNVGALISNVKIEYSINGGNSWNNLTASTPNTGTYSWFIPASVLQPSPYLIKITDATDISISDISDNYFSIRNIKVGDEFNNPITISSFPYSIGDTSTFYSDLYTGVNNQPSNDVFYKFKIPACADSMAFSTVGSNFDTYLHLIDSAQTVIEENDNSTSYYAEVFTKKLMPGRTYYLVVEGKNTANGIYKLNILHFKGEPKISVKNNITTFCKGDTVELSASNALSYKWSTGDTQQKIKIVPAQTTTYFITVVTAKNCTFTDSIKINVIPAAEPSLVDNMLPVDNTLDLSLPVHLSWAPAVNASEYDLYIWAFGSTKPATPTLSNINVITYNIGNLSYGTKYNWQVVAKNSCRKKESAIQTFTIEELPDLTLVKFIAPSSIASGSVMDLTWEVKNTGKGSTKSNSWNDQIYLSLDSVFGNPDDIFLGNFSNLSYLQVGQSYIQKQVIRLSPKWVGQYFIYAQTGYNTSESDKKNNIAFDTVQIYASPVPDLKVTSVGAPTAAFGGSKINVTYQVKNIGKYFAEKKWIDKIFISRDSVFEPQTATALETITIDKNLTKDSSYTNVVSVTIPHSYEGTYYIYVFTDSNNDVFEYVYEDNNTMGAEFPIIVTLRPPADLQVVTVVVPSNAASGKTMDVNWKVSNEGGNPPIEYSWTDRIYLCKLTKFNLDSAIILGEKNHSGGDGLMPNTSYDAIYQSIIPNNVFGDYYVYVHTDAKKEVFEYTYDDNNITRSNKLVKIAQSPAADLVVTSIVNPDSVTAGNMTSLTWITKNVGVGMADKPWREKVYLSKEKIWDVTKAVLLNTYSSISTLDGGKSFTQKINETVPVQLSGDYYVFALTDAENSIYENTNETNNMMVSAAATFIKPAYSDVTATDLQISGNTNTGQLINVSWQVTNKGKSITSSGFWNDALYISADSVLDNTDVIIKNEYNYGVLSSGASYSRTIDYQLKGFVGSYYLILIVDENQTIANDTLKTNNIFKKSINIILQPPPDLIVDKINFSSTTLYAGQQLPFYFTVKNAGTGPTLQNWFEGIYINNAPVIDHTAIKIGTFARTNGLAAANSYSDSIIVAIPSYLSGNYYLIFRTDNSDKVYEHLAENNNIKTLPINIVIPLPSDLVVSNVTVPDSVILGQDATLSYTVKNIGSNLAIGNLKNALHISADNVFNGSGDPLFNLQSNYLNLKPGDSLTSVITQALPGVMPSTYYGIARTNTANNIIETDYNNNERASDNSLAVIIPALQLDIPKDSIPLDFEKRFYYKVTVASDLDLLITLNSNQQIQGVNEVYVAYEKIPTPTTYEFKHAYTNAVNQKVLVPATKAGTYYIMLRCLSNFNNLQRVTLLARTLPFSILSINPNVVGQGIVTCTLDGAGFRDSTLVVLKNKAGIIVDTAETRQFISSMQLKVRWHLDSVPLGKYDVWAINKNGASVSLVDGLTVELAKKIALGIYGDNPTVVRTGRPALFSYVIENRGNVDIPYSEIQFQVPDFISIEDIHEQGFLLKTTSEKTDEIHALTLFARDITPNQVLNASFKLFNFKYATFPISVYQRLLTTKEYLREKLTEIEEIRKNILLSTTPLDSASFALINDSIKFKDFLLKLYVQAGIFESSDILKNNFTDADNSQIGKILSGKNFSEARRALSPPGCNPSGYEECVKSYKKRCYLTTFVTCVVACTFASGLIGHILCDLGCHYATHWLCDYTAELHCINVVKSCDPNDIIGPKGYDKEHWIAKEVLPYTINFENDSIFASAPVQRVKIVQKLNDHLNPFSFRLGDFGFGKYTFKVPANSSTYHTVLNTKDSIGVNVEVTAGLDIAKKEIFWVLQSIDPATGGAPYDPLSGFLPINNYTGKGKGFVNYTVQPKLASQTRDSIFAEADIVFDINDPIKTPQIFNTIDAYAPTSVMDQLPPLVEDTAVTITWKAQDDTNGCGVKSYALYVSENKGSFNKYTDTITTDSYRFNGNPNTFYEFYVLATDHVGNQESPKAAETSTTFGNVKLTVTAPLANARFCAGDSLFIKWVISTGNIILVNRRYSYNIDFSVDSSKTFKTIAKIQTTNSSYTWLIPDSLPSSNKCFVRVSLNGSINDLSEQFAINTKPKVNLLAFTAPVCINAGNFTMTGGSPLGGIYSGKGVSLGSFNPAVAGVGKHVITYTYKDSITNCSNSVSKQITVEICTNINSASNEQSWDIYPNPTMGVINLDYFAYKNTSLNIRLINIAGEIIFTETHQQYKGKYHKTINLSLEKQGVYLLQIITDKEVVTRKIVKN